MARRPSPETIRRAVENTASLEAAARVLGMTRAQVASAIGRKERRGRPRLAVTDEQIAEAVAAENGSMEAAAHQLGMAPSTVRWRMSRRRG